MHVVIFEVRPNKERYDEYLDIATALRSELAKIDGFISIERFTSMSEEGKILSLSFWRDEEAITAWREQREHRHAQRKGRHELFEDYRIRIAAVVRDYGMFERDQAPPDAA